MFAGLILTPNGLLVGGENLFLTLLLFQFRCFLGGAMADTVL